MLPSSTTSLLRQFFVAPTRCARDLPRITRNLHQAANAHSRSQSSLQAPSPRNPYYSRAFVSASTVRAAVAQRPATLRTELVSYPTSPSTRQEEEDDDDDPEIELVPPEEAVLEMTDRAAEQLRTIVQRENNPQAALRVLVESGGCHGYQYKLVLAEKQESDDYHFSHPRIKPSNLYVDAVSMTLLNGSTVDFATELIGSSFRVTNNPQAKNSGCGCGVSWELKE